MPRKSKMIRKDCSVGTKTELKTQLTIIKDIGVMPIQLMHRNVTVADRVERISILVMSLTA